MRELATGHEHLDNLAMGIESLRPAVNTLSQWAEEWLARLEDGARLLAAGNGGSAAEAQHLTAELVGRYRDERPPFSAIALHAETSTVTALINDYGADRVFARQVKAHGRPGDILVLLSTSGRSANLLSAAQAAAETGVRSYALTGPGLNPLASMVEHAVCIEAPSAAAVQELQLAAVHMICSAIDIKFGASPGVNPMQEMVVSL